LGRRNSIWNVLNGGTVQYGAVRIFHILTDQGAYTIKMRLAGIYRSNARRKERRIGTNANANPPARMVYTTRGWLLV
jgi:hypothetical protein